MIIKIDDLQCSAVRLLITEHLNNMALNSPPESIHALPIEALQSKDITFWSAWHHDELLGCGALKRLTEKHGEIKSMRTVDKYRRQGVASKILQHIIQEADKNLYEQLSLETGSMAAFLPAQKLYQHFGFNYCQPFANYSEDPNSVFMTKILR